MDGDLILAPFPRNLTSFWILGGGGGRSASGSALKIGHRERPKLHRSPDFNPHQNFQRLDADGLFAVDVDFFLPSTFACLQVP